MASPTKAHHQVIRCDTEEEAAQALVRMAGLLRRYHLTDRARVSRRGRIIYVRRIDGGRLSDLDLPPRWGSTTRTKK